MNETTARTTSRTKNNILNITIMGLLTAIICVLAPLSIPLPGNVPISLTNFIMLFIVYLIGGRKGTICCGLYLLIGLIGLPVFSGFAGGIGKLVGPTGGYLIGFIFMAAIAGLFLYIGKGKVWMYIIGCVIGVAADYAFGSIWYMHVTGTNLATTLSFCVYPFLLIDAAKIAVAAVIGVIVKKPLRKVNGMENVIAF